MHSLLLAFLPLLALPSIILAAPLETRQTQACAPTSYSITDFEYTSTPGTSARIYFNFQSHFSDTSIITDAAQSGSTCDAESSTGTIPIGSNTCSPGTVSFDLRAPQENAEYQLIHQWTCNGQTWMSSTPHKIDPLNCSTGEDGSTTCTSTLDEFQAENVRCICAGPTHCDCPQ